jgi:predicted molibdopterin-dependent oxidoreductase YjgC
VGAILSRIHLHSYRLWQIDREVETICPYCGVGCSLVLQVRDESIKRAVPKLGLGLNNGLLCSKGRFGYEFAGSPERLKTPLIRIAAKDSSELRVKSLELKDKVQSKDSSLIPHPSSFFREASWEEALNIITEKLTDIRDKNGGDAIAGIASARCTNEDNYIFQKFMRTACRTNHIDSVSRTGFVGMQKYFEDLLGQGITSNLIAGLKNSDAILAAGEDPTAVNPVLGLSIRAAARKGAKIAVIGNMPGLKRFKTHTVIPPLFKEAEVLEALLAAVAKGKGIRGEKPAIDSIIAGISQNSPEQNIEGLKELADVLLRSGSVSIVLGADAARRKDGHRTLFAIAGLTYLLEARLYLLSEKPNEQGLIDMGCLPDTLPGGRPLGISDFRKKFETKWKTAVPAKEGLTLMKIIEAAKEKKIKAMYVMGENPVFNLPDSSRIKEALSSLDFLVVQDIFLTETAELADVVLPAACWPGKEGTFTNLERRIQLLKKAVNTSPGMEDWKIIAAISGKMGCKMAYSDAEEIMQEIARVSPLYKDLTYSEIAKGNCLWPYHGEPLRGWLGEVPAAPVKPKKYNAELYIAPESILFHSGTLSRRASALRKIYPEPLLKIGAHHAGRLSLKEGDAVSVSSAHGSVNIPVSIDPTIKDNKVLLSNNFENAGVFSLIGYNIDPVTNIPGIEGCEVTINKL